MKRFLGLVLSLASLCVGAAVTPLEGVSPQRALAGDVFPVPIAVRVTDDAGNAVEGAEVHWAVGIFSGLEMAAAHADFNCFPDLGWNCWVASGANGVGRLPPIYAPTTGTFSMLISARSGSREFGSTRIVLTAEPRTTAASVVAVSGSGQRAVIHSRYATPLVARVVDATGSPVQAATVEFRVTNSTFVEGVFTTFPGGTFATEPGRDPHVYIATTDAGGYAISSAFTASNGIGLGHVTARYFDGDARASVTATFDFTNTTADGSAFVSFQDLWWGGPSQNGWGVAVIQDGTKLFNVVFAYDAEGLPRWHAMTDGGWDEGLGSTFRGLMSSPRSAPYYAYDASRFQPQSPGFTRFSTPTFDGPESMTLRTGTGFSPVVEIPMKRLDFSSAAASPLTGVGGMWWGGPAQDGWGIAMMEQPGGLFPVWMTYDDAGVPLWFALEEGRWVDSSTFTGVIHRTRGSPWPEQYDASRFREAAVGTFAFRFADLGHATFEYALEGHSGSVPIERFRF